MHGREIEVMQRNKCVTKSGSGFVSEQKHRSGVDK